MRTKDLPQSFRCSAMASSSRCMIAGSRGLPTDSARDRTSLVRVAAEIVHGRGVEAAAYAFEGRARDVDLRAFRGFVRTTGAADGAVDDVHARLPRDDAHATGANARVADVEIATFLGDDGVTRELDGLAVDPHQPIALADDGVGAFLDVGGRGLGRLLTFRRFLSRDGVARAFERRRRRRRGITAMDA